MIIGMVLRIWSIVHLGKFFTVNVAIQEGQRVIQDGPYRFVRHPSYSGSILAIVGLACLTFNWLVVVLVLGLSRCSAAKRARSVPQLFWRVSLIVKHRYPG